MSRNVFFRLAYVENICAQELRIKVFPSLCGSSNKKIRSEEPKIAASRWCAGQSLQDKPHAPTSTKAGSIPLQLCFWFSVRLALAIWLLLSGLTRVSYSNY